MDRIFLPEVNRVNAKTLNYAPVAVEIIPTYVLGYKRPLVVRGVHQADRRCAHSLLLR